jgi:hypothetical protein
VLKDSFSISQYSFLIGKTETAKSPRAAEYAKKNKPSLNLVLRTLSAHEIRATDLLLTLLMQSTKHKVLSSFYFLGVLCGSWRLGGSLLMLSNVKWKMITVFL